MKNIMKVVLLISLLVNLHFNKTLAVQNSLPDSVSVNKVKETTKYHVFKEIEKHPTEKSWVIYFLIFLVTCVLLYFINTYYLATYAKKNFHIKTKSIIEKISLPLILDIIRKQYTEETKVSERFRGIVNEYKEKEHETKIVNELTDTQPNILDNKVFIKLVEEIVYIIKRLDERTSVISQDSLEKLLLIQTIADLKDALERVGLEKILFASEYDPLQHDPFPLQLAEKGYLVDNLIENGLKLENRVFLKAKVKLKKD